MALGYACLTIGVQGLNYRTCTKKYATEEKLTELIDHNLTVLDQTIEYNRSNQIHMFRISSDIIPFGSSEVNRLPWEQMFRDRLAAIGAKARDAKMRLSMHPGQYTVLNSPDSEVVARAVLDLEYHTRFLDSLGLDQSHKIILHIGGAYGDKQAAVRRFEDNYRKLDEPVRKRLVIENDDRLYHAAEVYELGQRLGIPVVFDVLHHQVNGCSEAGSVSDWIERCRATWRPEDGRQKIHYSQQQPGKKPGSHSETIRIGEFQDFYQLVLEAVTDVMLEVKDKNLSAIKCIRATAKVQEIRLLEEEWARYKYTVLEHDPAVYQAVRQLLKDKSSYPAVEFYSLIEQALEADVTLGHGVNAVQHVWGYFSNIASPAEKKSFQNALAAYEEGRRSMQALKAVLKRLAVKYNSGYLLDSYYFEL